MTKSTKRINPWKVTAVAATLAVLAAACGSSSKSAPTTTTAPAAPSSSAATASSNAPATTGASANTASGDTGAPTDSTTFKTNIGNAGGGPLADESNAVKPAGPVGTGLTRGITDTSVSMGCVYTVAAYSGFETGIKARFASINAAGGIDGRQLKLNACTDDASDPQTHLQSVQQAVNQDKVFGVFTVGNVELPPATDFLNNNQVPFYGWGFEPGFCGDRWGFGWNGCIAGSGLPKSDVYVHAATQGNLANAIIGALNMKPADVRFGILSQDNTAGHYGSKQQSTLFEDVGAKVVYNDATFPDHGSPDVTPYVQAIMKADPNIVYISTPFNDVGPMAAGLKAAGYKGITMDFTNYIPGLLDSSPQLADALQGEYVNTQIVPQEQETPFIKQIEGDLTAIGEKPLVTLGLEIGYIEAELFVEQLQAVGQKLDTKTFDDKVNGGSFTSFTSLSGGPGKVEWPAGHLLPADCASIVKIDGTKYDVVSPFTCFQSYRAW